MTASRRPLQIGHVAPGFTAPSTQGDISLHDWIGDKWVVLTAHPFENQVSTSEIAYFQFLEDDFAKRGAKIIAIAPDDLKGIQAWQETIATAATKAITIPIVADDSKNIAHLYNMVDILDDGTETNNETVHDIIIIDPEKVVRAIFGYPVTVGASPTEILRVLDALQTPEHIATPAGWQPGDPVVVHHEADLDEVKDHVGTENVKAFGEGLNLVQVLPVQEVQE